MEKASGAKLEKKKIWSGAPEAVGFVIFNFLPSAHTSKLMPNVLLCFLLDYTGEAERGILLIGHPWISVHNAQACVNGEVTSVPLYLAVSSARTPTEPADPGSDWTLTARAALHEETEP